MKSVLLFILIISVYVTLTGVFFTVDETKQILITRFGQVVRVEKNPGLHVKLPVIDIVNTFDDRVLDYDSAPQEIITADKKTMVIDNYAKWKISDLVKFYGSVGSEYQAKLRLDDIVYSILREKLGRYNLDEIVSPKRAKIMDEVASFSREKMMADYGIEVIDVRIKRADLPKENEKHIYERMQAEREKQAKQYRAEGREEESKIMAEADMKQQIILSEAMKEATSVRGAGDAEALKIYAEAFSKDPEFYSFFRTMQAYEEMITKDDTLIFGSGNELFRYIKDSQGK